MTFTRSVASSVAIALALALPARADGTGEAPLTGYSWTFWTTEDALYPGPFRAITQDRDGYLWLAVSRDLVRFDGVRFVHWLELGHPPLKGDGIITALYAAGDGSLWIGSTDAITRFADGSLISYSRDQGLPAGGIAVLQQDREGTLWAGGQWGLARFEDGHWYEQTTADGSHLPAVLAVYQDSRDARWVGTTAGTFVKPPGASGFVLEGPSSNVVSSFSEDESGIVWSAARGTGVIPATGSPATYSVQSVAEAADSRLLHDREGRLWVASRGQGLFLFPELSSAVVGPVQRLTRREGLTSDVVLCLFEDSDGNIWAGTDNSLMRLRKNRGFAPAGLEASTVREVTAGVNDSVWIGTTSGLYQISSGGRRLYTVEDGLPSNLITALPAGPVSDLWVGTDRGLAHFSNGRFDQPRTLTDVPTGRITALTLDHQGRLWTCAGPGELGYVWSNLSGFTVVPVPTRRTCLSAYTDTVGRIWIGFSDGSVMVFDETGVATYRESDGLTGSTVTSIFEDSRGTIWVGTNNGVVRFKEGRFTAFGSGHGLPSRAVFAGVEDDSGSLWFSVIAGLIRVASEEFDKALADQAYRITYHLYDQSDGFSGAPLFFGSPNATKAKDGRLWFITTDDVAIVNPLELPISTPLPRPQIETVVANGQRRAPKQNEVVPPLRSELRIAYTAFNFAAPQRTQFRYLLEGIDRDWIEVGETREAIYASLPPGDYRFLVAARYGTHQWNPLPSIWSFSVQPTLIQTQWFFAMCLIAGIGVVWAAFMLRLGQQRHQLGLVLAERTRVAREIHDTLLQSLAGIALRFDVIAQAMDNSPTAAKTLLWRARDEVEWYIREARQSIWQLRSPTLVNHNLAWAIRDTCSRIVINAGIEFRFSADDSLPPLDPHVEEQLLRIAQEATANAVRHSGANTISIELTVARTSLKLTIVDNGVGFDFTDRDAVAGTHWGLLDIKERVEQIGGTLKLNTSIGQGTELAVTVYLR